MSDTEETEPVEVIEPEPMTEDMLPKSAYVVVEKDPADE